MDPLMQSMATEISIKVMTEIEELADEIMTDHAQIIDCDRKRNANREALRILRNKPTSRKEWFCVGNLFLKLAHDTTVNIIEDNQLYLDKESKKIQDELKPKVKTLHELEGKDDVKGFDLKNINEE